MRIVLNSAFGLGLVVAFGCGAVLIWWDLSGTTRSEQWRTQTGTVGYLAVWLACMIAYIDRLWRRAPTGSESSLRIHGDFLLGWVIALAGIVLAVSGLSYLTEELHADRATLLPLGLIRLAMSGLLISFGAALLREDGTERVVSRPIGAAAPATVAQPSRVLQARRRRAKQHAQK